MDLAKIRQKARQEQQDRLPEEPQQRTPDAEVNVPAAVDAAPGIPAEMVENVIPHVPSDAVPVQESLPQQNPVQQRAVHRSPLDIILAGREAAGCEEELPLTSIDQDQVVADAYHEFLCFRVSDEIYGINIMDIKELIKPREVTEVPRAPAFVSGVISLRGTIIPIIDMLGRLGLAHGPVTGRERVVVVRHGESISGLLVDEIIQVVRIADDCLENTPTVLEGIDREFVSGIGRADGRMIILLNLENITDINLY